MNFDHALNQAAHLLGTTDPTAQGTIRHHLTENNLLRTFPKKQPQPLAFVDGALAREQTDTVVWIVATANTTGMENPVIVSAAASVSANHERVASALMALCEMKQAARGAQASQDVWMDGGLATPLISLSTALTDANPATSRALLPLLETLDAETIVSHYVDLAAENRLRALPKQDTARAFSTQWSQLPNLTPPQQEWARTRSDRTLSRLLLQAGEVLAPRNATETLSVQIKSPTLIPEANQHWIERLTPHFHRWRNDTQPWVTYMKPTRGIGRSIKIEFCSSSDETSCAHDVASMVNPHIEGAQIIEPLPQYLVDCSVKQTAAATITDLMATAAARLGSEHPEAVGSYRS